MIQWGLGLFFAGLIVILRGAAERRYVLENVAQHEALHQTGLALVEYLFDFSGIFIICGIAAILAGILIQLICRKGKCPHCGAALERFVKFGKN